MAGAASTDDVLLCELYAKCNYDVLQCASEYFALRWRESERFLWGFFDDDSREEKSSAFPLLHSYACWVFLSSTYSRPVVWNHLKKASSILRRLLSSAAAAE